MAWVCGDCGRPYEDPPASCQVCGGEVVPAGDPHASSDRISLAATRERLLDPFSAETSLVDVDPRVALAFRVVVAVAVLVLAVLVGSLLLG